MGSPWQLATQPGLAVVEHPAVPRQVVPPTWVLSSVEDASVQLALREIGLLEAGTGGKG